MDIVVCYYRHITMFIELCSVRSIQMLVDVIVLWWTGYTIDISEPKFYTTVDNIEGKEWNKTVKVMSWKENNVLKGVHCGNENNVPILSCITFVYQAYLLISRCYSSFQNILSMNFHFLSLQLNRLFEIKLFNLL